MANPPSSDRRISIASSTYEARVFCFSKDSSTLLIAFLDLSNMDSRLNRFMWTPTPFPSLLCPLDWSQIFHSLHPQLEAAFRYGVPRRFSFSSNPSCLTRSHYHNALFHVHEPFSTPHSHHSHSSGYQERMPTQSIPFLIVLFAPACDLHSLSYTFLVCFRCSLDLFLQPSADVGYASDIVLKATHRGNQWKQCTDDHRCIDSIFNTLLLELASWPRQLLCLPLPLIRTRFTLLLSL